MKIINVLSIILTALFVGACASKTSPINPTAQLPTTRTVAATFKNGFCWKGYSSKDQKANLNDCQKQARSGQICETSMYVHEQAAFDVCLRIPDAAPTRVVSCLKGFNQNEQNKNLETCRRNLSAGQICETSWNVHKQALYDTCIME